MIMHLNGHMNNKIIHHLIKMMGTNLKDTRGGHCIDRLCDGVIVSQVWVDYVMTPGNKSCIAQQMLMYFIYTLYFCPPRSPCRILLSHFPTSKCINYYGNNILSILTECLLTTTNTENSPFYIMVWDVVCGY